MLTINISVGAVIIIYLLFVLLTRFDYREKYFPLQKQNCLRLLHEKSCDLAQRLLLSSISYTSNCTAVEQIRSSKREWMGLHFISDRIGSVRGGILCHNWGVTCPLRVLYILYLSFFVRLCIFDAAIKKVKSNPQKSPNKIKWIAKKIWVATFAIAWPEIRKIIPSWKIDSSVNFNHHNMESLLVFIFIKQTCKT